MEDRIAKLEAEVSALQKRNKSVEAEKAWETSWTRAGSLLVITYIVAALALSAIGNDAPLRNALIPTVGYLLSTVSIPFLKRWWIESR